MHTMDELLASHPFFADLGPEASELMAGCAVNLHLHPGDYLFRQGDAADRFFVVRHGRVALELSAVGVPGLVLDTVDDGGVVGWSWLVAPHRWFTDARATTETSVISLDGLCLRQKCDEDPALGYAVFQRVAAVMYQRLRSARVRLLDLYGGGNAGTV